MRIVPNMSKPFRIGYLILGLAMMIAPFALALTGGLRVAIIAMGGVTIISAAVGW